MLGNVLAEMAGMPYDSLIHDTVIAPLGQTNTGVNMSKAPRSNLALPYTDSGSPCGAACLAVSWRGGIFPTLLAHATVTVILPHTHPGVWLALAVWQHVL